MSLSEKDEQLVARGKAELGEMRTGELRGRSARGVGNPDLELSPLPRQHP